MRSNTPASPEVLYDRQNAQTLRDGSTVTIVCLDARHQRRREARSAACGCYVAPDSSDDPLPHEHDFAHHTALPEQLVRLRCLGKRK